MFAAEGDEAIVGGKFRIVFTYGGRGLLIELCFAWNRGVQMHDEQITAFGEQ